MFDAGASTYGQWPELFPDGDHVHCPARRDLNHEITRLKSILEKDDPNFDSLIMKEEFGALSQLQEANLASMRREKDRAKASLESTEEILGSPKRTFGSSKIASGYRTIDEHALDWAIGEPLIARTGVNEVIRPALRIGEDILTIF